MDHRNEKIVRLFRKQRGCCHLCGKRMTLKLGGPRTATVDHVNPLALGGGAYVDPRGNAGRSHRNQRAACASCNHQKGAAPPTVALAARK